MTASELFGHCRGAFTGAAADRAGLIEEVKGGTLFIDEVGDLSQETQLQLLHVLQDKTFRRIGSNKELKTDFRLITATNKTEKEMQQNNLLRLDFYHRIAHLSIEIPPLRSRQQDIEDLCRDFIQNTANRENLRVYGITPEALVRLRKHQWPGNVRELLAVTEGAVYRASYNSRRFIEIQDLDIRDVTAGKSGNRCFREEVKDFERRLVLEAMERCGNNQSQAARSLGLDRMSLRRILERDE